MDVIQERRIRIHVPVVWTVVLVVSVSEPLSSELRIQLLLLQSIHSSAAGAPVVTHILALFIPVVAVPVPIVVVNNDGSIVPVPVPVPVFVMLASSVIVFLNDRDATIVVSPDHCVTA